MTQNSKEIKIHLEDGSSSGIKRIVQDNWNGTVIVCPRSCINDLLSSVWKERCGRSGIYLLLDENSDINLPKIYIGESSNVQSRLRQQLRTTAGDQKFYWNRAFIFTSTDKSLDKAKVRKLELLMIERIRDANRATLMNKQNNNKSSSDRSKKTSRLENGPMETYLSYAQGILTILGVPYLDEVVQSNDNFAGKYRYFYFKGREFQGEGIYTNQDFVILKGSKGKWEQAQSLRQEWKDMRESLIQQKKVTKDNQSIQFDEDVPFKSPSAAASILTGSMRNGLTSWKDKDKRTIKYLEEEMLDLRFESTVEEKPVTKKKVTKKTDQSSKQQGAEHASGSGIKIKQLLENRLIKAGDKIWLMKKGKRSPEATLTKDGHCQFGEETMSLSKYAKEVTGEKSINIYKRIIHGPTNKLLDELRKLR